MNGRGETLFGRQKEHLLLLETWKVAGDRSSFVTLAVKAHRKAAVW